ncbi:hypothetical protein SBV1_940022 [Verrucomicrobia bacterium]|nr:hypothetical protein SBV1_940022 [Verrucomicrobiota bacterium]
MSWSAAGPELVASNATFPSGFPNYSFISSTSFPVKHGGPDNAENLALACPDCNLLKGPNLTGLDPSTERVVRLFHPRRDQWTEHFIQEGPRISGKTPVGRVTVSLLKVNDPHRLEIRALILGL